MTCARVVAVRVSRDHIDAQVVDDEDAKDVGCKVQKCRATRLVCCSQCQDYVCREHVRKAYNKLLCKPCLNVVFFCRVCKSNTMVDEVHEMCFSCAASVSPGATRDL